MKKLKEKWLSFSRKKKIWIAVGILLFVAIWYLLIMWWTVWSWDYYASETFTTTTYEKCDFGTLSIQGEIVGYVTILQEEDDYASAENIIYQLENLDMAEFPVIMLDITSWGGSPASSKEIADFVAQMKTPVVASIREAGLSGGYYIASQADKVFASPATDIGSIAVTMSYLDESRLNEEQGYTWNNLSTGAFKDAGSSDKVLTQEERRIFERDLAILHEMFVKDVARGRGLSVAQVEKLADGSSMLPEQALKAGLIDGIKHQWEVIDYIQENYNTGDNICWE